MPHKHNSKKEIPAIFENFSTQNNLLKRQFQQFVSGHSSEVKHYIYVPKVLSPNHGKIFFVTLLGLK